MSVTYVIPAGIEPPEPGWLKSRGLRLDQWARAAGIFLPDGVEVPSRRLLEKYGLSLADWAAILDRQGWACAVCRKRPSTGRFNVDHDHVAGWKDQRAEVRKGHVRGVVCFFCNKYYLSRGLTIERARAVLAYLEAHAARVAAGTGPV